jgi:hypothetical protein
MLFFSLKMLMGHKIPKGDITLHYWTVDPEILREIVEQLSDYDRPRREAMTATGTDGKVVDEILRKSSSDTNATNNFME